MTFLESLSNKENRFAVNMLTDLAEKLKKPNGAFLQSGLYIYLSNLSSAERFYYKKILKKSLITSNFPKYYQ